MAKCPNCEKALTNINFKPTRIREPFSTAGGYRGIIYYCPWCSHALSVEMDPVSSKADIVSGVSDELVPLKRRLDEIANALNQIAHRLNQMR